MANDDAKSSVPRWLAAPTPLQGLTLQASRSVLLPRIPAKPSEAPENGLCARKVPVALVICVAVAVIAVLALIRAFSPAASMMVNTAHIAGVAHVDAPGRTRAQAAADDLDAALLGTDTELAAHDTVEEPDADAAAAPSPLPRRKQPASTPPSKCRYAGGGTAYVLGTRDEHTSLTSCDALVEAMPREAGMLPGDDFVAALVRMRDTQHAYRECSDSNRMMRAALIETGFASAFQLNAADLLCSFVTNRIMVVDNAAWRYGCEDGNKFSCFFEDVSFCADPSRLHGVMPGENWMQRGQCSREVPPAFAPHDFNWFWGAVQAYQFRHKPRAGAHTSCMHHHVINAWAAAYHAVHGEAYPGYHTPVARGSAAWGDFKDCIAAGDADASAVLRAADVSFPRPRTVPRADAAIHTPSYTRSSTHGGIVVGTHLRRGDRMMHDKRLVGAMEYFQELAWLRHEGVHIAGLILATDDDETNVQALTATRLRLTMPGPVPPAGGSDPLMPVQYDFVSEADPAPSETQWDIPFALIPSQFVKPPGGGDGLAVILGTETDGGRKRVATEDIMNVISILSEAHAVMGLCMSQVNRMIAGLQLVKNNTFHRPMASDYKFCVSFSGHLWPIGEGFVPIHTEYARNGRRML